MIAQVAPDASLQAWQNDYPWFHQAVERIGPAARSASDGWRVLIENELKTTLDFKVRPDGTAAVWCGMSGYDFRHDPTPKELFEGLAEACRRERKRIAGSSSWKMSAVARPTRRERPKPQPAVWALPPRPAYSLPQTVGAVLVPRVVQLVLIFLAATAVTIVLSDVAFTVR